MREMESREELYTKTVEQDAEAGIRILALLAVFLFPVFTILDFYTQREHYEILSLIRFSTTGFFLCAHILFKKGLGLSRPVYTTNFLLAIASISITVMCMVLQGSQSP